MKAVLFGAGGVGRGFIAHLLSESGFQITFVDVDRGLVQRLNEAGSYRVRLAVAGYPSVLIAPVRAVHASETQTIASLVSEADLAFTAVGAHALRHVAPLLASGIAKRFESPSRSPLNVLVCENLPHAGRVVKTQVFEHLSPEVQSWAESQIGFAGVVVGRMIPLLPEAWRREDPLQVIGEDYWVLPVDGRAAVLPVPPFKGLRLSQEFAVEEARKLYLHNMVHAVLAYHGYDKGLEYVWEAAEDSAVRSEGEASLEEAIVGLVERYRLDEGVQREYASDLIRRCRNPHLMDTVKRVGRDPLRKLGPEDRLVGAARLATAAGVTPSALARGVVAALRFDAGDDPAAVELQNALRQKGVSEALRTVCQLGEQEPLFGLVVGMWKGTRT